MNSHPLLHPSIAHLAYESRQRELVAEAQAFRIARAQKSPNKIERFFIKRREGKITWIETVMVQRSA